MLLKKSGYETIVARSGTEALEFLAGMPPLTAAVIDIMLPGISGLELVREMRKIDEYMDTPVVMCSARADQDTIQDCLRQGLRYYILKPINEEELLKKLRMAMAEGVPVKEVRAETVRKLGIDVKTYDDTAQGFSVLLHDTVEEIQLQFEEKGEAMTTSALRDSHGIAMNADTVLTLHKPERKPPLKDTTPDNRTKIILSFAKNRRGPDSYREILEFEPNFVRFREWS